MAAGFDIRDLRPLQSAFQACMLAFGDTSMVLDPMAFEVDDAARVFAALADPARLACFSPR